jgi:hypothetical protein
VNLIHNLRLDATPLPSILSEKVLVGVIIHPFLYKKEKLPLFGKEGRGEIFRGDFPKQMSS